MFRLLLGNEVIPIAEYFLTIDTDLFRSQIFIFNIKIFSHYTNIYDHYTKFRKCM